MRIGMAAVLGVTCIVGACQEHAAPSLTPGQKKKVQAHLLTEAKPQHMINAVIEDQVRLIGYDIDKTEVAPGGTVKITYYIEGLSDRPDDNKLFVHFQGRKGDTKAWMNLDHAPVGNLLPLHQLKKGQIVKDVQSFTVRPDFPGGEAKIYWGLWRGNYRLKIKNAAKAPHDSEGRVIVATLKIKGGKAARKAALPSASATQLAAGETMTIDGVLDEAVWKRAKYTDYWVAPNGKGGDAPKVRARFAWDAEFLYLAVESEDTDVWSTFTDRDSNTWEQEVIELFIDADGNRKDYLELQVTPANVVFDAKFAKHRSDLAVARAWNMAGLKTAAKVDGTLNARDDVDVGYVVEMAVPVAQVPGAKVPLAGGQQWRVNLFRWDFPKGQRQRSAAFSPPVVGDFHALRRFGRLNFVAAKPPKAAPTPVTAGTQKPEKNNENIKPAGGGTK